MVKSEVQLHTVKNRVQYEGIRLDRISFISNKCCLDIYLGLLRAQLSLRRFGISLLSLLNSSLYASSCLKTTTPWARDTIDQLPVCAFEQRLAETQAEEE